MAARAFFSYLSSVVPPPYDELRARGNLRAIRRFPTMRVRPSLCTTAPVLEVVAVTARSMLLARRCCGTTPPLRSLGVADQG